MFRKFLPMATACGLLAGTAAAQLQPCSTDEHYQQLVARHPELVEFEKQFNDQVAMKLAAKTTAASDTTTYDVPLVVHVVHDYGTENLSDNDIYEAAATWALAYVKQNGDTSAVIEPFKKYIGNARIRLHLATKDPSGNPTKGVVRHHSYLTSVGDDQAKYESWPQNKYINIWFIGTFGASATGAAAYAYYPSTAAAMPYYDGVISLASYLNTSKTIPHELGHVLNLRHVWGNNNSAGVACGDDLVDDTPPTKGHLPGCVPSAIYDVTCATGYFKTYTSMSGLADSVVDYPDTVNAQNIMDYTYCANMFTIGQCARMRTALTSSVAGRNNLITASNLAATGALAPMPDLPPVADFTMNKAVSAGSVSDARSLFLTYTHTGSFSFRNASWNDTISSVNWTFSNGATTPTSTASAIVNNHFSVPGWVTVTLTATSNSGSNTLVRTKACYAADTTPVGGSGYLQTFGSESAISNWPMINYYNNDFQWEFYTGAGHGDNNCIRYKSYDGSAKIYGTPVGDYDDIFTPAMNLEGTSGDLYFNFFTTGASVSGGSSSSRVLDSMEVDVSTTGGARWTKIYGIRGSDLANNGNSSANFAPGSSTAWVARSVNIDPVYRTRQTFFRLRYRPGNVGNNVYVDDLGVSGFPAEVQEVAQHAGGHPVLFPNPTSTSSTLVFQAGNSSTATYVIKDMTGKVVSTASFNVVPGTQAQHIISREEVPAAGMYFVTLQNGDAQETMKLVVY